MQYRPTYHHATRRGRPAMSVGAAQEVLKTVEDERYWVQAKPETIELTNDNFVLVDKKPIGTITPRVITALKTYTQAPVNKAPLPDLSFDERRRRQYLDTLFAINDSLQHKEFRYDFVFRVSSKQGDVNGVVTERYQHLPFDRLLNGFPPHWTVPRMQLDAGFADIHVCHPEQVEGSSFGVRISTSDIGLMRAMLFMQILVLVCSNGMVSVKEVGAIKRLHLEQFGEPNIELDWDRKVSAFLTDFHGNYEVTRDALREAANVVTTEAEATSTLYRLGIGPVRIKAALDYAQTKFDRLTKFSVAQGLTYASQVKSLRSKDVVSIKQSLENDLIATQYLVAA